MSLSTRLSAIRAATRAIGIPHGNVALRLGYGLMRGASGTEAATVLGERRVPTLLQNLQHCLLDRSVDTRHAELCEPEV